MSLSTLRLEVQRGCILIMLVLRNFCVYMNYQECLYIISCDEGIKQTSGYELRNTKRYFFSYIPQ